MLFKRTPVPKNSQRPWRAKADAIIEAQKKIEIHAANIGENDLALGLEYLEGTLDEGFPWVGANLRRLDGEQTKIPLYRIVKIAGLKIGVLGLLDNKDRAGKSVEPLDADFSVLDPFSTARKAVGELKREGVDLVVVLSAMVSLRNHELAREVEGINFIVNGGDPRILKTPDREGETIIFGALSRGKYVGVAHVGFVPGNLHFRLEREEEDIRKRLEVIAAQRRVFEGEVASLPNVMRKLEDLKVEETGLHSRLSNVNAPSNNVKNRLVPLKSSIPNREDITLILQKAKRSK